MSNELPDEPSPAGTSSTASPVSEDLDLRKFCRSGVRIAGRFLHALVARDDIAQEAGLGLPDDDDARAIGDPVAAMIEAKAGKTEIPAEAAAAVALIVGVTVFGLKQLDAYIDVWQARRNRRRQAVPAELSQDTAGDRPQEGVSAASGAGNGSGASW